MFAPRQDRQPAAERAALGAARAVGRASAPSALLAASHAAQRVERRRRSLEAAFAASAVGAFARRRGATPPAEAS